MANVHIDRWPPGNPDRHPGVIHVPGTNKVERTNTSNKSKVDRNLNSTGAPMGA